jgi:hypothetical protein
LGETAARRSFSAYRQRVTSAIFKAVEKAGGNIQDTPATEKKCRNLARIHRANRLG